MALETLLNVTKIDGLKIIAVDHLDKMQTAPDDVFVAVDHTHNAVTFKIQEGPIREVGLNGCQVTDMLIVARHIFQKLNDSFPSIYNEGTLAGLNYAIKMQELRTKDRELRGVEGHSKA